MRIVMLSALFLVMLVTATSAAPGPAYTLYYLDQRSNVCSICLDSNARPTCASKRLSTQGGYDAYSVSPAGAFILGFAKISATREEDTGLVWSSWKWFLDFTVRPQLRRELWTSEDGAETVLDRMPGSRTVDWSPRGDYFRFSSSEFELSESVYSISASKLVATDCLLFPVISYDERYLARESSTNSGTVVIDLKTGARAVLSKEWASHIVWIGNTHKIAWADETIEGVWIAEVRSSGSAVEVVCRQKLGDSSYTGLKYLPNSGLYFEDASEDDPAAYASSDLKSIRKTSRITEPKVAEVLQGREGVLSQYAVFSPDRRFIACPVSTEKAIPQIAIFDRAGRQLRIIAKGRMPSWKIDRHTSMTWRSAE